MALAVGLHFRAVGAPIVNLLAVGIAYLVSIRVMAWVGRAVGVSVPAEVQPVVVVLLFGVVTDYSIFFLTRLRRRLGEGADGASAARQTTAELAPIIVTAGLTVAAGSASLAVAKLGFLQAFGPGMAMAVLVALAVALTFVPAALAIGGNRLFWPVRPPRPRDGRRPALAARVVRLAVARPLLTIAGCLGVLATCAAGLFVLEVGNPLIRGLPSDSGPRRAYAQARQGFAAGVLSPTVLVVARPRIARQPARLRRLQRAIERQPGVAQVIGPAQNATGTSFGAVLSRTGNAARYVVVFASDPLGATAIAHLRLLRKRMPGLLREAGVPHAEVSIAGDTALAEETIADARADLLRVLPVALLAIMLILAVFLRSLVAPLYLVAAAALAPLAALGLGALVFQGIFGQPELAYYVPVAATVLLIALGSDYNVFLAGRVWDEAHRRDIREAVEVAGAGAAGAIAAAGLVLAASFALLAIVPLRAFGEIAFVMASGLVIDAFLVRALLVPALISLVGSRSGWPSHRLRRTKLAVPRRSSSVG